MVMLPLMPCVFCLPPPLPMQGDAPKLSRKQRQLIARVQHAKTLRQKSGSVTSGSSAAAASSAAGDAASDTASSDTQQQGDQLQQRQLSTAMTSSASSTDLTAVIEPTRNSLGAASSTAVSKHGNASSVCSTAGSVTTAAAKDRGGDRNSSGGSRVHACVVLDPIYSEGRIMGYLAERSFLCPRGESGAVKLVLRDVLGLLKAEGRQVLNLGLAVAHEVKSGKFEFELCNTNSERVDARSTGSVVQIRNLCRSGWTCICCVMRALA
jgi:hypothetical protein